MPRHDWEAHKPAIIDKYKRKGMRQMMSEMSDIGFDPARRSYFNKFEEWGIKKYSKREKKGKTRSTCRHVPASMHSTSIHQLPSSETDVEIPLRPGPHFHSQMGEPATLIEPYGFNIADSSAGRDEQATTTAELWPELRRLFYCHDVEIPRSFHSGKTMPFQEAVPFYSSRAGHLPVPPGSKDVAPEWDMFMTTEPSGLNMTESTTEASVTRAPIPSCNALEYGTTPTMPLSELPDSSTTHKPTAEALVSQRNIEEEFVFPGDLHPAAANDVMLAIRTLKELVELLHDATNLGVDLRGVLAETCRGENLRSRKRIDKSAPLRYRKPFVSMVLGLIFNALDLDANRSRKRDILDLHSRFLVICLRNEAKPTHFASLVDLLLRKIASSGHMVSSKPQGIRNPSPAIDPALTSSSDQQSTLLVHDITNNPFNSMDWSFDRLWGTLTTPEIGGFDFQECHEPSDFLRITEMDMDRDSDQPHQQGENLKKGKQLLPRTPPPPSPNWGDWIQLPTTP